MTTWTSVTSSVTNWSSVNRQQKDTWSEWSVFTWAQIEAMGLTWAAMAGDTFIDRSGPATTWTSVL